MKNIKMLYITRRKAITGNKCGDITYIDIRCQRFEIAISNLFKNLKGKYNK